MTPAKPYGRENGGRPRRWQLEADQILAANGDEWTYIPPRDTTNAALMVTLRRTYFPNHKLKSRQDDQGGLFVKIGGPKVNIEGGHP